MRNSARLIDRMRTLRARRTELQNRILDELSNPAPDRLRLQTLKRMKLHSKDQINLIRGQLGRNGKPDFPSAA